MSRVLLADGIATDAVRVLGSFGIETVSMGTPSPPELLEIISEFDAIVVRSPTRVSAEVIERGTKLRFIGRAGVGVDNIDVEAATRRGIVVMNSPRSNTISTAEHTLALMLAVAREVPRAHAAVTSGTWERDSFRGVELCGKTLGVIGLGRVGREVAKRAAAFGMTVLGHDPLVGEDEARAAGARWVALPELYGESDWVTLHVPLSDSTRRMLDARAIASLKKGVVVVNCARGGLVDENALADALDSGHVAAVAFDVFEKEPPGKTRLFAHPRSVFAPHLGAATIDAQRRVATDVAESIGLALTRGEIRDAVNTP
ncbi:MAG: NAD(P)-binding domain-containing protein [Candidatus Latescibacteria bacterium]|nr:NAD(P)-binding domain-containing protein [Candidatus Latescibacterota bacterium]